MRSRNIRAGRIEELRNPTGDWTFVDLGFAKKAETCGYLADSPRGVRPWRAKPTVLAYGILIEKLLALTKVTRPPLHLVLEAPLSSAFQSNGNPIGRKGEKRGRVTSYWYEKLGCAVLVSGLYLIQRLAQSKPRREIRLFEGLASFKPKGVESDHKKDVRSLRKVVKNGGRRYGQFLEAEPVDRVDGKTSSTIYSTMMMRGLDPTPPPIVVVFKA